MVEKDTKWREENIDDKFILLDTMQEWLRYRDYLVDSVVWMFTADSDNPVIALTDSNEQNLFHV